jgi:GH24 family phage-related lysozyme (muramidase)
MLQAELQQLRTQQEAVLAEREAERVEREAERQRIQALEAQQEGLLKFCNNLGSNKVGRSHYTCLHHSHHHHIVQILLR